MRMTSRESSHIFNQVPLTEEENMAQMEDMAVLEQIKNEISRGADDKQDANKHSSIYFSNRISK